MRARTMAALATVMARIPGVPGIMAKYGNRLGFKVWRPELHVVYSSRKLLDTDFEFEWDDFAKVMGSCMGSAASPGFSPAERQSR